MSGLKVKIRLPVGRAATTSAPPVADSDVDVSDVDESDEDKEAAAQGAPVAAQAKVPPGANAIMEVLQGRKRPRPEHMLQPVFLAVEAAESTARVDANAGAAEEEEERPVYSAWETLCDYDGADGPARKSPTPKSANNEGSIPREALVALWKEAVALHRAQLARLQKRRDLEQKMKEDRAREMQALREQALQVENMRKREEDQAKEQEEKARNEARERARQERERLAQTIDMDAQQELMMDQGGDEEEDEDLAGF